MLYKDLPIEKRNQFLSIMTDIDSAAITKRLESFADFYNLPCFKVNGNDVNFLQGVEQLVLGSSSVTCLNVDIKIDYSNVENPVLTSSCDTNEQAGVILYVFGRDFLPSIIDLVHRFNAMTEIATKPIKTTSTDL